MGLIYFSLLPQPLRWGPALCPAFLQVCVPGLPPECVCTAFLRSVCAQPSSECVCPAFLRSVWPTLPPGISSGWPCSEVALEFPLQAVKDGGTPSMRDILRGVAFLTQGLPPALATADEQVSLTFSHCPLGFLPHCRALQQKP